MSNTLLVAGPAGPIASWVEGDGPDLLMVHGGPGLSDYMSMVSDEARGWRTIRFQQRGLPPSVTSGPFDVGQHVADALAVLDHEARGPAVVLGHSWGGHLALQVALAAGDRVRAVLVIDGLGSTGDGGASQLGAELRRRLPAEAKPRCQELDDLLAGTEATDDAALESLRLLWPGYFADPPGAPPFPAGLTMTLAGAGETTISAMEQLADGSFARDLSTLALPIKVIVGGRSPMPREVGEETAEIGGGRFLVVEEGGHLPWHERPGCIADALAAWR